jgi:hypothetical protein
VGRYQLTFPTERVDQSERKLRQEICVRQVWANMGEGFHSKVKRRSSSRQSLDSREQRMKSRFVMVKVSSPHSAAIVVLR